MVERTNERTTKKINKIKRNVGEGVTTPVGWSTLSDRGENTRQQQAPTRPLLGQYWSRLMTHPMAIWGATNPPLSFSISTTVYTIYIYIYTVYRKKRNTTTTTTTTTILHAPSSSSSPDASASALLVLFQLANTDRHNTLCVCFAAISRRSHPVG